MDTAMFFRQVHKEHHRALLGYCWHKLRNIDDAEEAVQETFLRLWKRLENGQPVSGNVRALAFSIAHNVMIDTLRKQRDVKVTATEYIEEFASPSAKSEQPHEHTLTAKIRSVLALVGPKEREALLMHYVDGHSVPIIVELLNSSDATIRKRIDRGTKKIRSTLAA